MTSLPQLIHKSILEIDSLLNDFQQEIQKEQSELQAVDQEIENAGLPGYSLKPRANHTGNHTGHYTRPTLFPYPPGHFTTTTKDPWKSWNLPGLDYSSTSNPFNYVLPHLGDPLNQTTPFNSRNYSALFTRPSFPFQRPVRPPRTELPEKYISNASHSTNFPVFTLPTEDLLPPRAAARTLSKFFAMSDWQRVEKERSWHRPRGQRLTKANRMRATGKFTLMFPIELFKI